MSPETRKTIDTPHPNPVKDCPTCGGSGIEAMRVADADKVDITCRDCLKAEWFVNMAKLEDGQEIGAGLLARDPSF